MKRFVVVAAAVVGLVAPAWGPAGAAAPMADVIVVLHDGTDARAAARDMARAHGAEVSNVYRHALDGFAAKVPAGRLHALSNDRRVAYVNDNGVLHALEADAEYPTGVERIESDVAHGTATGAGVRVAVIDTGVDLDHPDLAANIDTTTDKDCINNDLTADDDQGHGTHVAGSVAAIDNGTQVIGVAPGAEIVPVKVLNSSGSGSWAQVICGIDHVTALNSDGDTGNDVRVANMSLGASGSFAGMTCASATNGDALFDALCRGIAAGTTYTVAAGNDSQDASGFVPAAHPDVITVSSSADTDGQWNATSGCSGRGPWKTCDEVFSSFSNYGLAVDVIAPGSNITSTTMGGGTGVKSGTSMAAPHAAGVVALILEEFPSLTPAAVAAHLGDTGQCPDGKVNAGTGYCVAQGTWNSDPDSPATEPMVNAASAATILPGTGGDGGGGGGDDPVDPDPTGISLSATGFKVKGKQHIDLTWSGAVGDNVDVYENGTKRDTTANDGADTYVPNRNGGGTYTYKVCETGTTTCSNESTVTF